MRIFLITAALLTFPLLAALPPRSKENLKEYATHIVIGEVKAVYTTEEKRKSDWIDRLYVIEVMVSGVEKGEGTPLKKVLYAKCWTIEKRPQGWAGGQGQNDIPEVGKTVRLYLQEGEDGSLSLMNPNGWEEQKP